MCVINMKKHRTPAQIVIVKNIKHFPPLFLDGEPQPPGDGEPQPPGEGEHQPPGDNEVVAAWPQSHNIQGRYNILNKDL